MTTAMSAREPARRWITLALLAPAALSAALTAVLTYRWIADGLADRYFEGVGIVSVDYMEIAPRDYLPSGAPMAALALLCTAVGGQLLRRSPWRSALALGATTAVLVLSPSIGFMNPTWLTIATVWAGTAILWCVSLGGAGASNAAESRTASEGAAPPTAMADSAGAPDPDLIALSVTAQHALAVFSGIVTTTILGLIVFTALGGLWLFFGAELSFSSLRFSTAAHLAFLAVWSAWLTGSDPAGAHTVIWRLAASAGVALIAVEWLVYEGDDATGAITALGFLGIAFASNRKRLSARAVKVVTG